MGNDLSAAQQVIDSTEAYPLRRTAAEAGGAFDVRLPKRRRRDEEGEEDFNSGDEADEGDPDTEASRAEQRTAAAAALAYIEGPASTAQPPGEATVALVAKRRPLLARRLARALVQRNHAQQPAADATPFAPLLSDSQAGGQLWEPLLPNGGYSRAECAADMLDNAAHPGFVDRAADWDADTVAQHAAPVIWDALALCCAQPQPSEAAVGALFEAAALDNLPQPPKDLFSAMPSREVVPPPRRSNETAEEARARARAELAAQRRAGWPETRKQPWIGLYQWLLGRGLRIVGYINRGAFGGVFGCEDLGNNGAIVALKIMRDIYPQRSELGLELGAISDLDAGVARGTVTPRFASRVARPLRALHLCAAKQWSAGVLVFPRADSSLWDFVGRNKDLSERALLYIAADVFLGVAALHRVGRVVCDLKPQNVLLFHELSTDRRVACLTDFGSMVRPDRLRQSPGSPKARSMPCSATYPWGATRTDDPAHATRTGVRPATPYHDWFVFAKLVLWLAAAVRDGQGPQCAATVAPPGWAAVAERTNALPAAAMLRDRGCQLLPHAPPLPLRPVAKGGAAQRLVHWAAEYAEDYNAWADTVPDHATDRGYTTTARPDRGQLRRPVDYDHPPPGIDEALLAAREKVLPP